MASGAVLAKGSARARFLFAAADAQALRQAAFALALHDAVMVAGAFCAEYPAGERVPLAAAGAQAGGFQLRICFHAVLRLRVLDF